MNNREFANKARDIADNYRTSYVWGAFGLVANASNMQRMINQYSKNNKYLTTARAIYGNGFFFDCVGLIKGILWGWYGNASKTYGGATYASNGVPDVSADQMIAYCKEVSTDFSDIEIGEVVWLSGHIGIYIGDRKVVEATPSWNSGVQISDISTTGKRTKNGSGSSYWKKHGKLPYITYIKKDSSNELFTDVSGHYAENHIVSLASKGVISGYGDGTFKPDANITRAEFASMVVNSLEKACGYTLSKSSVFADTAGHWSETIVGKLVACGIVNGFEDGTFKPDIEITRGQAAIMASNMLHWCGVTAQSATPYPDTIGHYADAHIQTLQHFGVVNGYEDGTFKPDISITRGQAAMMILNCLAVLGK